MKSLNRIDLIGNIGQDLELKNANGLNYVSFSVATTETWKNKESGEDTSKTEWHKVVFFKAQAETLCKYVKKGNRIFITGKMTYRKYTDKDGIEKTVSEIIGNDFTFLETKKVETKEVETKHEHIIDYTDEVLPF